VGMDLSFGVTVIPSVSQRSDPVAEARHAEELGYDLVTVWDHLHGDRP
jgi:alkanesulfonate monooxygenase SsuD/methylene tetrahydromethanopterin reductase-like flavin-dependent oxidoreductase (luciferase family)